MQIYCAEFRKWHIFPDMEKEGELLRMKFRFSVGARNDCFSAQNMRNSMRIMRNKSRGSGIKNCVSGHIMMLNGIVIGNPLYSAA